MFENYLYHYTSAEAFISILLNRKFWATDFNFMNDDKEGKFLVKGVKKRFEQDVTQGLIDKKVKPYFDLLLNASITYDVVSFCEIEKSLNLFRLYGGKYGGYSIGFPRNFLDSIENTRLIKCIYVAYEHLIEEIYQEVLPKLKQAAVKKQCIVSFQKTVRDEFMEKIYELSPKFKAKEFSVEEEQRLFLTYSKDAVKNRTFRVSNFGNVIIPYREIDIPNEEIEVHIVLGPNSAGYDLAQTGYEALFHTAKLNGLKWHCIIDRFDTSYRFM